MIYLFHVPVEQESSPRAEQGSFLPGEGEGAWERHSSALGKGEKGFPGGKGQGGIHRQDLE